MDKEQFAENVLSFVPLMFKRFMRGFPHAEISKQQLELLFRINRKNCKPMSYYSEKMMVSKSNLTVLSDKIINEGLAERVLDPHDRRIVSLKITEKGKKYLCEHKEKMRQLLIKNFDSLNEEDIDRLNSLLEEMKAIFNKIEKQQDHKEEIQ